MITAPATPLPAGWGHAGRSRSFRLGETPRWTLKPVWAWREGKTICWALRRALRLCGSKMRRALRACRLGGPHVHHEDPQALYGEGGEEKTIC